MWAMKRRSLARCGAGRNDKHQPRMSGEELSLEGDIGAIVKGPSAMPMLARARVRVAHKRLLGRDVAELF